MDLPGRNLAPPSLAPQISSDQLRSAQMSFHRCADLASPLIIMGNCWSNDDYDDQRRPFVDIPKIALFDSVGYENVKDIEGEPTGKRWYHGKISNDEADNRIRYGAGGTDGSYIVYDNPYRNGQYILLVYYRGQLLRWKIRRRRSDGMYFLGEEGEGVAKYKTVRELIHAHRGVTGKPIKMGDGGVLRLSKSYVYVEN